MLCVSLSSAALPPGQEFMVNLSSELMEIVVETRYLEQLGFPIPEHARNMALQEEKLLSYQDGLKHVLQRYRGCIEALQPAEVCKSTVPLHLHMHWHTREHRTHMCTYSMCIHTHTRTHTHTHAHTHAHTHTHTHIHTHTHTGTVQ